MLGMDVAPRRGVMDGRGDPRRRGGARLGRASRRAARPAPAGLAVAASQPDGASRASRRDSNPPASLRDDNYYSAALSLLAALADRPA